MKKIITPELIAKIRKTRLSGKSVVETVLACGVSQYTYYKHCGDIEINLKKRRFVGEASKPKEWNPCTTYAFSNLSEADQSKYNKVKPAIKERDTYITGEKGKYGKEVVSNKKNNRSWETRLGEFL